MTKRRSVTASESSVTVTTNQGQSISSPLVVGADGRHSLCREAAGIGVKRAATSASRR